MLTDILVITPIIRIIATIIATGGTITGTTNIDSNGPGAVND
jgi:hypothetical protein